MASGDTVLVHVVLATFYPDVPQETREVMHVRMDALGQLTGGKSAGILHWQAAWNLDQRKSYHLVEFGIFVDQAALQAYRVHPEHVAFAADMSKIADWVVGDIHANLPGFHEIPIYRPTP